MLKLLGDLVRNCILLKNGVGELGYPSQSLASYLDLLIFFFFALFVSLCSKTRNQYLIQAGMELLTLLSQPLG